MLTSHNHNINQCVVYEDQDVTNKLKFMAHDISMCDDKNCQSTKCVHMQSVKPAMTQSSYKKFSQLSICDDKNSHSTKSLCDDMNCQSTRCVHMQPVKPAIPQSSYKKCSNISSDTVNTFVVNVKGC